MIVGGEPDKRLNEIIERYERAAKESNLSTEDAEALRDVIADWKQFGAEKLYRFASHDTWNFPIHLAILSAVQDRKKINRLRVERVVD